MSDLTRNENQNQNEVSTETEGVSRRQMMTGGLTVLAAGAASLAAPQALAAPEPLCIGPVELSEDDQKNLHATVEQLRYLLKDHDLSLKSITALVTPMELEGTHAAIDVRFAEETTVAVVMNMLAFEG